VSEAGIIRQGEPGKAFAVAGVRGQKTIESHKDLWGGKKNDVQSLLRRGSEEGL